MHLCVFYIAALCYTAVISCFCVNKIFSIEDRCGPVPSLEHAVADTRLAVSRSRVHYHCHLGYNLSTPTSSDDITSNDNYYHSTNSSYLTTECNAENLQWSKTVGNCSGTLHTYTYNLYIHHKLRTSSNCAKLFDKILQMSL